MQDVFYYIDFFMEIATVKAEATTRTGLPLAHTTPSTQPLTWQLDIKLLAHREQIDDSTVRKIHPGVIKESIYCLRIYKQ